MNLCRHLFIILILSLAISGCKKDNGSSIPNPNIIKGCVISSVQVVTTNLSTQQINSYVNSYQYDGQYRLTTVSDGQHNDTDHYRYSGDDCDGDNDFSSHSSSQGYVVSSTQAGGSYQYSYDGKGYIQLETFTDLAQQAHGYTLSYYWDNAGNLSYTVKQMQGHASPITTSYSYYTDKSAQLLVPSSWIKGQMTANLVKQVSISSGATITDNTCSYIFDALGKVEQYTEVANGQQQTVYTLSYTCH